jgi:tetratricopeptide (TPR) repeat protein
MDSLINAAARALAAGDPIGALNHVALREDPPALALRGIAMAQLGDLAKARALLRRASHAFGPREALARARCVVAEAEVALASRDLAFPVAVLASARAVLDAHEDSSNAAHARYLEMRRLLLIGRLDEAERKLALLDPAPLPPALKTAHALVVAGIAMRRLQASAARDAIDRALREARSAGIRALIVEVENAAKILDSPAARLVKQGREQPLLLAEVEALLSGGSLVIDACRNSVQERGAVIPLARRPVLFALVRSLATAWPNDVPRAELLASAFGAKFTDESHRVRLRVEIGRLRRMLHGLAGVNATEDGFVLAPRRAKEVVVLVRPVEEGHATILALLADGESWSSSALALALGSSQRTVQRALDDLAAERKVQFFGRGRARRWLVPPLPGFVLEGLTTPLLLPVQLSGD